jgi:hypothetical protein
MLQPFGRQVERAQGPFNHGQNEHGMSFGDARFARPPLVPGGLGLVEGSLAVLLMSSGMPATVALASVVLYHAVSFWVVVPAGWGPWGYIAFAEGRPHPA